MRKEAFSYTITETEIGANFFKLNGTIKRDWNIHPHLKCTYTNSLLGINLQIYLHKYTENTYIKMLKLCL